MKIFLYTLLSTTILGTLIHILLTMGFGLDTNSTVEMIMTFIFAIGFFSYFKANLK